jgi:hypothetical protein
MSVHSVSPQVLRGVMTRAVMAEPRTTGTVRSCFRGTSRFYAKPDLHAFLIFDFSNRQKSTQLRNSQSFGEGLE